MPFDCRGVQQCGEMHLESPVDARSALELAVRGAQAFAPGAAPAMLSPEGVSTKWRAATLPLFMFSRMCTERWHRTAACMINLNVQSNDATASSWPTLVQTCPNSCVYSFGSFLLA
jgi:hypothetical protein